MVLLLSQRGVHCKYKACGCVDWGRGELVGGGVGWGQRYTAMPTCAMQQPEVHICLFGEGRGGGGEEGQGVG